MVQYVSEIGSVPRATEWLHAVITYWNEKGPRKENNKQKKSASSRDDIVKVLFNERLPVK